MLRTLAPTHFDAPSQQSRSSVPARPTTEAELEEGPSPSSVAPRQREDEMQISVLALQSVIEELRRRGANVDDLVRSTSMTSPVFADARTMISVASYEQLVLRALHVTRDPGLGLLLGSAPVDGMGHLLSHFALAVPTLRDAIAMMIRYHPLFVDGMRMSLSEVGNVAYFRFGMHEALQRDVSRFSGEYFASLCVRVVSHVFAPGQSPLEVRFRHEQPSYADRYQANFNCPVKFGASECVISFDTSVLDKPQPAADGFVADLLRDACERMLVSSPARGSVAGRVRAMLRRQPDLCRVDQDRMARELGMGRRMLRRRLAREGATMTSLIDEARVQVARVELLRPGGTIKETAEHLGYSEISAFHRAFKRWTGKTPADYVRAERGKTMPPALEAEP